MKYKPNNYKGLSQSSINAVFTGAIVGLARIPSKHDEEFILEWIRMEIAAHDEAVKSKGE